MLARRTSKHNVREYKFMSFPLFTFANFQNGLGEDVCERSTSKSLQ